MLLLDVDGVLTDGSIILGNNNIELKSFDIYDGFGIKMAQRAGIKVGIITGRVSDAVSIRARELELDELYQGKLNKIDAYNEILTKNSLTDDEIAYVGDDLFDLPILLKVGFSVAVANARTEVKQRVDYVTKASGGSGAVREVIDLILNTQNKMDKVLEAFLRDD